MKIHGTRNRDDVLEFLTEAYRGGQAESTDLPFKLGFGVCLSQAASLLDMWDQRTRFDFRCTMT